MPSPSSRRIALEARLPATWALIALVVAVHLGGAVYQWWLGYEDLLSAIVFSRSTRMRIACGGQYRSLVTHGEVWRLVTSNLTHASGIHLLVNAVAIGSLGRMLEPWIGGLRLVGWFFLAGLGGAIASQAVGILATDGASGAAFGWMGAVTVLGWRWRKDFDTEDQRILGPWLWAFVALNIVLSFALPFINAAGHIGGLIVGALLGLAWRGPWRIGTVAWALFLVLMGGVAVAGWAGELSSERVMAWTAPYLKAAGP